MIALLQRSSLLLFLLLVFNTGCAGLNLDVDGPVTPGPNEGTARVYFVLAQGFPSGEAYVVENTTLLGYVRNKEFFYVDVPAGEHLFMLISEQTEGIRGTFEAGKTYHMKLYITPGIMGTRTYWSPLENSGEDAKTRIENVEDCQQVTLNPDKVPSWEARYAERNTERVQNFNSGEDDVKIIEPKHGL